MAVIKKNEMRGLSADERKAKVEELERSILQLRGEGMGDRVKPLRKAIAALKTPQKVKKD